MQRDLLHRFLVHERGTYLRIDKDVRQSFRKPLNLEQSVDEVNAEAERLLNDGSPAYQPVTWTPIPDSAKAP